MRTTKKQLEAANAAQSEEIKALNLRVKFWVKHADAILRLLGGYDCSRGKHITTLVSMAEELRRSAERPLPSEDLLAAQLEVVAPLAAKFYEKEDALVSRMLRIPIPMKPGGEFKAVSVNEPPPGGFPHQKLARKRKIAQPNSRPKSPPKRPTRSRPT